MLEIKRKTKIIEPAQLAQLPWQVLLETQEPVVIKGLARQWGLVQAGLGSSESAMDYLQALYNGKPLVSYLGNPDIQGRFFYNQDVTGFNFQSERLLLGEFFQRVKQHFGDAAPPSFYIGSTTVDTYFPDFLEDNQLALDEPMFEQHRPLVSIWLGNHTIASAHYDLSNNIACCLVGHRRFTLFPPEQIHNLYPGPLEPTPGGQVVSMVDFDNPDDAAFPRFKEALSHAQVADMGPGDVLFYPSMWWHQVEALDKFNVMVNYWWNTSPQYIDTPMNTLLHGLLSLRDRPEYEKRAWKELFDYYIFGAAENAGAHLPEHARGNLGPMDEISARRLRAYLLNRLNR